MQLNKAKSGIIAVRLDGRTKAEPYTMLKSIRLVQQYTYLGIKVDEFLRLNAVDETLKWSHRMLLKKFAVTFQHIKNPGL